MLVPCKKTHCRSDNVFFLIILHLIDKPIAVVEYLYDAIIYYLFTFNIYTVMRYLWLIFILCVCSATAHADDADTDRATIVALDTMLTATGDPYTNFDYKQTPEWKRYKVLRAVGWSAVGVSVPTLLIGTCLMSMSDGSGDIYSTSSLITGGVLLVSGIAMLVTAYDYRSKAKSMAVSLSAINTPSPIGHGIAPALSLSLTF